jgi:hypothetical protein
MEFGLRAPLASATIFRAVNAPQGAGVCAMAFFVDTAKVGVEVNPTPSAILAMVAVLPISIRSRGVCAWS